MFRPDNMCLGRRNPGGLDRTTGWCNHGLSGTLGEKESEAFDGFTSLYDQSNRFTINSYHQIYNVIGELKACYEWIWHRFCSLGDSDSLGLFGKEKLLDATYRRWRKRRSKVLHYKLRSLSYSNSYKVRTRTKKEQEAND